MIQFGLGIIKTNGIPIGHLQNVTIDFTFEETKLKQGDSSYPVNVQTHSAAIEGTAEAANINTEILSIITGGDITDGALGIGDTTRPITWSLTWEMITGSEMFTMTAEKCKSNQLGFNFERENFVIPKFDFNIYKSKTSDTVFTISSQLIPEFTDNFINDDNWHPAE